MKMTQPEIDAVVEAYKRDPKSVWGVSGMDAWITTMRNVDDLARAMANGGHYEVREPVADAMEGTPKQVGHGVIEVMIPSLMAKCAKELTEKLMDAFITTPQIQKEYVCHEDVHFYSVPDTDTIRRKVLELIKNWRPDEKSC